jgi:RNA polymerase sigma factor (sigma-70 family)
MQFEDENSNIEENFFRNDELLHREKLLTYLPALVQSLKLEQQELIKMYFYDGLSYSDIGQALGITKQSAFEKMRTILKKLKKLL